MGALAANVNGIRAKIAAAARRSGRDPEEVQIIAVSKTVDVAWIKAAMALGIRSFGENRAQELAAKAAALTTRAEWHFIGHLQTNKVKYIIDQVTLIHSLDRLSLAKELNRRAKERDTLLPVLIQVNIAAEKSKFGLKREAVIPFLQAIGEYSYLDIQGLMTMAPLVDEAEAARPVFRSLRQLRDEILAWGLPAANMRYLSMGMTNDYEIAVEEGANLVRIGSGIFGKRY